MKQVRLKYAATIGKKLYPAGHVVPVASLETVRQKYPNIHYSENSRAVAVHFSPEVVTFVHGTQIEHI